MKTVSVDKPWLMPEVIDWLAMVVHQQMTVLETGSGGSTVFFAKRGCLVISYEHDHRWALDVGQQLARFPNTAEVRWLEAYPRLGLPPGAFHDIDLAFIDGRGRVLSCKGAWPEIKPGGWLVLDDSDRERYAEARAMLDAQCATKIVFRSGSDETTCWRKP